MAFTLSWLILCISVSVSSLFPALKFQIHRPVLTKSAWSHPIYWCTMSAPKSLFGYGHCAKFEPHVARSCELSGGWVSIWSMDHQTQSSVWQLVCQITALFISIILNSVVSALLVLYPNDPIPYHTSILTGEAWVLELLTGHLKQIYCKLGVHVHVFNALVNELYCMGYTSSRSVSLEEQLSIFLYCCIRGVTVCYAGEWFQRSNNITVRNHYRWNVGWKLTVFIEATFRRWSWSFHPHHSTPPMCSCWQLKVMFHHKSATIRKFGHFFKDYLGTIDGSHIHLAPPAAA